MFRFHNSLYASAGIKFFCLCATRMGSRNICCVRRVVSSLYYWVRGTTCVFVPVWRVRCALPLQARIHITFAALLPPQLLTAFGVLIYSLLLRTTLVCIWRHKHKQKTGYSLVSLIPFHTAPQFSKWTFQLILPLVWIMINWVNSRFVTRYRLIIFSNAFDFRLWWWWGKLFIFIHCISLNVFVRCYGILNWGIGRLWNCQAAVLIYPVWTSKGKWL